MSIKTEEFVDSVTKGDQMSTQKERSIKVCALVSVWNCSIWLPHSLRGIYDKFDQIVVSEACWVPDPQWSGETSPDGTAAIIEKFIEEEDVDKKIFFIKGGMQPNQPTARNIGLHLIKPDIDYVFMVDGDEFYFPDTLKYIFSTLQDNPNIGLGVIPAKCFYFDLTYYKNEPFHRIYKWFPGQRFHSIASMECRGDVYDFGNTLPEDLYMYHGNYATKEYTKIKACQGEDLSSDHYRKWWDNVYSKFDGDNLEELYKMNSGGVHVNGGGTLERYYGPYPDSLIGTGLADKTWKEMYEE